METVRAPHDLGLRCDGSQVSVDHPDVIRVSEGAPIPVPDRKGRRDAGAFDTPMDMARGLVARALSYGMPASAGDYCCGVGGLLVALLEAGVERVEGVELDPRAAAIARVAAPGANVRCGDVFDVAEVAGLVVGNPPFVPVQRQDTARRAWLRERFSWLSGRVDLSVPIVAYLDEIASSGTRFAWLLPQPLMSQKYATPLRRLWLQRRVRYLGSAQRFPGAAVQVVELVVDRDAPARLPWGVEPHELAELPLAPLCPDVGPEALAAYRGLASARSIAELARVDTGLVAHGPKGGKARLMREQPGEDTVPYADARGVFEGVHGFLAYRPDEMHRAKDPELFEAPKLILQRVHSRGPLRVKADRTGLYVGHTCIVVVPHDPAQLEPLERYLSSDEAWGQLRVARGDRLDVFPRDIGQIRVPESVLSGGSVQVFDALGQVGRAQSG